MTTVSEPQRIHAAPTPDTVLDVRELNVAFRSSEGLISVVDDINLTLERRRTLALVGESGSGKTTIAKAIMGLIDDDVAETGGQVLYNGNDLLKLPRQKRQQFYGRDVAMIFQEATRSLNPAYTVGDQIAEAVRTHMNVSRRDAWKRAIEVMDQVGIVDSARRATRYPFEFSGGMCQRIMIAMAISCRPSVLIADEPTTALDVTVQAQVLDLLKELQDELGLAMLFITHDLGVVADIADDVSVLYAGQMVESGSAEQVFYTPQMPYTCGLLQAIPNVLSHSGEFAYIRGDVPPAGNRPVGCRFGRRCTDFVEGRCDVDRIPLDIEEGRLVRCVRSAELHLEGVRR